MTTVNLAIDVGNSKTKVAVFEDSVIRARYLLDRPEPSLLEDILTRHRPSRSVLAAVTEVDGEALACLRRSTSLHLFPGEMKLPVGNLYESPSTLGADRLAAVTGAASLVSNGERRNRLVLIAGTCITANFIDSQDRFLGGSISPGLRMRLQAMHTFTGKLPLVTMDEEYTGFLGRNTRDSMLAGVLEGSLGEVEKMIGTYVEQYPDLQVLLCGGDAGFFDKRLKNSIFADRTVLDRDLILKGLDRALNYQYK